jgi:multidrug efflux pump subunit AcrB
MVLRNVPWIFKLVAKTQAHFNVQCIGLIIGSFSLLTSGFIGSEFVSAGDNGEFTIEAKLNKDATIEQTN